MTSTTITTANQMNTIVNETPVHNCMRAFVDYLDNGIDFPALSQIQQLDLNLRNYYNRVQELIEESRNKLHNQQETSESQSSDKKLLINMLQQAKTIGDMKLQLSQQILDTTQQQSKYFERTYRKYVDSNNQQNFLSNNIISENESDSEPGSHRSLATINPKRKLILNGEPNEKLNINERERKKLLQRNMNSNIVNSRRLRTTCETFQSDKTTYCLCAQLSYGSMILCDSKACEIKWFHFNCVNLTTKPKGKWFCPACRDNRTRHSQGVLRNSYKKKIEYLMEIIFPLQ